MAEFSRLMITGKGQALIAKMMADSQGITFTKVSSSDAVYELSQLEGLDSLTEIKQTSVVSKITRVNEATVKIETSFSNTELTEGYYMRALGLYAEDPDEGEILYAAAIETSGNCYLPAYGGMTVSGAFIQLVTTVGNEENVSLEVDNSAQATIGDIRDLQEQIDQLGGIVGGVSAQAGLNAARLNSLNRMGSKVYIDYLKGSKTITDSDRTIIIDLPAESFSHLSDKTYYLYVLDSRRDHAIGLVRYGELNRKEFFGSVCMHMRVGIEHVTDFLPISMGQLNWYTTPVLTFIVNGPPNSDGIKISFWMRLFERGENGVVELEGNVQADWDLTLSVYKLGYLIDTIQSGDAVLPGGAAALSNYNLLQNKPSINNVTLQGDLTSQQLGLGGDASGLVEMTAEEVEAIINQAEESEV